MALNLHNLRPAKGAKKKKKRIGRGNSSGHGTYSGRGMKGQRSRTGGKGGLKLKGLRTNILSIPKLGGFQSLRAKLAIVNLKDLEKHFADQAVITPLKLLEKGLIKNTRHGVKLLGDGKLTKKFTIKVDKISNSALEAVTKSGSKLILLTKEKEDNKSADKTDSKKS